jgi:hypothetical protein
MKSFRIFFFVLLSSLVFSTPAGAASFEFQEIELFRDTLWLGNSVQDSAPSPILGVWGAAARFKLTDLFSFRPELGFYGMDYFYQDNRALPAEIEYKDAVGTLCILVDPVFMYSYPFNDPRFSAGAGVSPTLAFKIPLLRYGDAPDSEVASYFLENLRFFHVEIRGYFDWNFSKLFGLSARLRTLLPLYRLWDGEGSPFYDGLLAGGGIGLRIRF